jgi:hypothetical protein
LASLTIVLIAPVKLSLGAVKDGRSASNTNGLPILAPIHPQKLENLQNISRSKSLIGSCLQHAPKKSFHQTARFHFSTPYISEGNDVLKLGDPLRQP